MLYDLGDPYINGCPAEEQAVRSMVVLSLTLLLAAVSIAEEKPTSKPAPHPYVADYKSDKQVSQALLDAYVEFATRATQAGDLQPLLLPHAVAISAEPRPEEMREYGPGINLPFLKSGFSPTVLSIRKDAEDAWLIRTNSSAIWFVETKSGGWRVYQYLDKPIE
jgi:hypothetical protein